MTAGLAFDLGAFLNLVAAMLTGSAISFAISRYYSRRSAREVATMLRTLALTLEQHGVAEFGRIAGGDIDLLTPARITGKLRASLPSLRVSAEGRVGEQRSAEEEGGNASEAS